MIRPRLHWGVAVALAYTLFACTTVGFVVFALTHPVELVSADYYERALAHDARRAAIARADALGDALRVEAAGDTLAVTLPAAHAATATGTLTLYRPSDIHADRVQPLAVDRAGRQRIALDGLARGRWLLRLEWTAAGETYLHEEPLVRP